MRGWRIFLLVLCALITGAYLAREPWIVYQQQKAKAQAAREDQARSEKERADLVKQKAESESSAGREKAARERGYVGPGEKRMGPDGP